MKLNVAKLFANIIFVFIYIINAMINSKTRQKIIALYVCVFR